MGNDKQRKIAFKVDTYDEIKAYSEYSGVPMARLLSRLWEQSKERKEFMGGSKSVKEIIKCTKRG